MKKLISLFMTFIISVSFFTLGASAVYAVTQDSDITPTRLGESDTYYSFDSSSKTLTISGNGDMPDMANASAGTKAQPWYYWRSNSIDKVVVKDGVTSIGSYAFCYVYATEFEIAQSVKSIGDGAFYCAGKMTSISLPSRLERIGGSAFYKCLKLESILIPDTVTSIGSSAFENCSQLKSVNFACDYMYLTIASRAFLNCPDLSSIELPLNAQFSLRSYCFGFYEPSAGSTYDNFTVYAYCDSTDNSLHYRYAEKYGFTFVSRGSMRVAVNDVIRREFTDDNISDTMAFTFVPDVTDEYTFSSLGNVNADCRLYDSSGKILGEYDDNSEFDRNFTAKALLKAGEEYTFGVTSLMSYGQLDVRLVQSHSYIGSVVPPDLHNDGFTVYKCTHCGCEYKDDFTPRTGKDITGTVVLMQAPGGEHPDNLPLYNICVSAGEYSTLTSQDGTFNLTVEKSVTSVKISSDYCVERNISLDKNNIGAIPVIAYDFVRDGRINSKDYAWFRAHFKTYDRSLDYNCDARLDNGDWIYAENYFTYPEIDESIYYSSVN